MANAPIYFALGQVRFSPVLSMGDFVPGIQERMRRAGFVGFESEQQVQIELPVPEGVLQAPSMSPRTIWNFYRSDRSAGYLLTTDAVTFQTTAYGTHEEFIPRLLGGLAVVHEAVDLSHVTRLGLRYLDAIQPRSGEKVADYLADGLRGLSVEGRLLAGFTESVFEREPTSPEGFTSRLIARVYRANGGITFPSGLGAGGLSLADRFSNWVGDHGVIDTDHFIEADMSPVGPELNSAMLQLHDGVAEVFKDCASEHALAVWKGER